MTKAAARVTLAAAFSFYRCSSSHVIPALICAEAWDLWLRFFACEKTHICPWADPGLLAGRPGSADKKTRVFFLCDTKWA